MSTLAQEIYLYLLPRAQKEESEISQSIFQVTTFEKQSSMMQVMLNKKLLQ